MITKVKKDQKVVRKKTSTEKKLKLNINSIKHQFEENVTETNNDTTSPTPIVNKLDPNKYLQNAEGAIKEIKKKEYVPVIIDKAAFERTVGMFEKERQEEEERKINEERLKKRRADMVKERERLIEEKKQREEEEKRREEEKRARMEEERKMRELIRVSEQSVDQDNICEQNIPINHVEKEKLDIQERIRLELEKIQREEEIQKEKIKKENKKRELMRQIQNEIERIKAVDSPVEDDTPTWIKMMMDKSTEEPKTVIKKSPVQRSFSYDPSFQSDVDK